MPKETLQSKKQDKKEEKEKVDQAKDLVYNEKGFSSQFHDTEGKMNQHNDFIYTGQGGGTYERDADTNLAPGSFGFTMFSPRNKRIVDPSAETNFDANDQQKNFFFSDPSILAADNLRPGTSTQSETMYSDWKGQGVTSKEPFPAGAIVPQNKNIDQKNPTHFFQSGKNGNPATGVPGTSTNGFILYDSGLAQPQTPVGYDSKLFETDGLFSVHASGKSNITPNLKNDLTPNLKNPINADKMGSGTGSGKGSTRSSRGGRSTRTTKAFANGFSFNVTAAERIDHNSPNGNTVEMANRNGDEMVSDTRNKPTQTAKNIAVDPNANIAVAEPVPGTAPLTNKVPEETLDRGMHFDHGTNNDMTFWINRVPNNPAGNGDEGRVQEGDKDEELFKPN